eukprot:2184838-Ditylum_brightwellii.AAC.1
MKQRFKRSHCIYVYSYQHCQITVIVVDKHTTASDAMCTRQLAKVVGSVKHDTVHAVDETTSDTKDSHQERFIK